MHGEKNQKAAYERIDRAFNKRNPSIAISEEEFWTVSYLLRSRWVDDEPEWREEYGKVINVVDAMVEDGLITNSGMMLPGFDMFNHAYEPNAEWDGRSFVTATQNIKAGDEIFFDYGNGDYKPESNLILDLIF